MPPQTTSLPFTTLSDLVEHALDYLGGTPDDQANRDCLRSVQQAYREVTNARTWSYLYTHGRVETEAPYNLGTIAYYHTGYTFRGTVYPRAVVLTPTSASSYLPQLAVTDPIPFPSSTTSPNQPVYGMQWPLATGPGWQLRVSYVTAEVERLVSPYILTLTQDVNFEYSFDYQPVPIVANGGSITIGTPITISFPNHGLTTGNQIVVENVTNSSGTLLNINNACSVATNASPSPSNPTTWTVTVVNSSTFTLDSSVGTGTWDGVSGTWRRVPTTTFTLYHDEYLLPSDYIKSDTAIFEGNFGGLIYTDPTDALWWQRFTYSAGIPRWYTLTGSRYFPGRQIIRFAPYPDLQKTIDFIYIRRPRDILIKAQTTGSVTVTSGSITVTANGFTFPPTCQGSILRLGTTSVSPGSWLSPNPPTFETWIYERISDTTISINDAPSVSGNYAYNISDPIDCEQESTLTAIMRGIEKYLCTARNIQGKPDPFMAFAEALRSAQAADSRSFQGRSMGAQRPRWVHPKYMPALFFPASR